MRFNIRPLRRLQWQLSLSYTLVAVAALLVVEVALLASVVYLINSDMLSSILVRAMRAQMSSQLRPFLDRAEPDVAGLNSMLNAYSQPQDKDPNDDLPVGQIWTVEDSSQNLLVVDTHGNLLWSQFLLTDTAIGQPFPTDRLPGLERVLPAALANERAPDALYTRTGSIMVMALPITDESGQRVLGIAIFQLEMPTVTDPSFILQLLPTILISVAGFTIAAGVVGSVFGFFTARRLTRRLGRVSQAADAWSRGDFTIFIRDSLDDELGELARRLNAMAEQLQNLMNTRQDLAALEERNRIARDLHDSVKQQVFATAMQLGAARALLPENDDSPASQRLAEAERLTRQAQSELTTLIHELRPVALEGKGLVRALREMVSEWSRQSGITAQFHSPPELLLPLLKEQAVFRIVQEALANIARHSHATSAEITLTRSETEVQLEIRDDGRGFDPASAAAGKGIGLRSMRERIESLQGRLEIKTIPNQGTYLVVKIPTGG
jgi:two-component system, NarL family, sensor histidine kinase LiaS